MRGSGLLHKRVGFVQPTQESFSFPIQNPYVWRSKMRGPHFCFIKIYRNLASWSNWKCRDIIHFNGWDHIVPLKIFIFLKRKWNMLLYIIRVVWDNNSFFKRNSLKEKKKLIFCKIVHLHKEKEPSIYNVFYLLWIEKGSYGEIFCFCNLYFIFLLTKLEMKLDKRKPGSNGLYFD